MSVLELVLVIKIIVTVLFVIFPLLVQTKEKIGATYGIQIDSNLIFNLYMAAIIALLCNYSLGLLQSFGGQFPETVVYVGIVSNVGAALVLLKEKFSNNSKKAKVADLTAIIVFGGIGLLFIASVIWKSTFTATIW